MSYLTIVIAEDDPDDRFILQQAFRELGTGAGLRFVEDGEELMHYLRRSGKYVDLLLSPRPALILLDLNMPKKDGRQALIEIKADPDLQGIPVAVWTASEEVENKIQCEKTGADVFVTKPVRYAELLDTIRKVVMKYSSKGTTADEM
jgi:CheY-like chemotaxis protein